VANFKLQHLLPELVEDFRVVLSAYCLPEDISEVIAEMSIPRAFEILNVVSRNRAYDDSHPAFVSGRWRRVLPFDGRKYCFYYVDNATDNHVRTLLKYVIKELQTKNEAPVANTERD